MFVATTGRLVLAATLVAGVLAGCGAGGTSAADSRKEIVSALQTGLTTNDPVTICETSLSSGLVGRVYGSPQRCLAVEGQNAASRTGPRAVDVTQVKVDGDRGSASVVLHGGDQDGARGGLSLVRQDGKWRLDDLSTAFLRSEFSAGLSGDDQLQANLTACVGKKVVGLDDASLRRLAFGAMGGRPEAQVQLRGLVTQCIRELSAGSSGDVA